MLCDLGETQGLGIESYSPFCLKVHRALRATGLAYTVRNAPNPAAYKRHNPKGQVPVLLVGDEAVTDSTRILARTDSNETTNFYSNLVGAIAVSLAVPFFWTPQSDPKVIVLMCIMGLFSGMGHYLLIIGHRLAPASVLAPFIYTEIVWMIALGYVVFGDVPNRWTLAGVAVVTASGLYLLYRERMVGPRRNPLD